MDAPKFSFTKLVVADIEKSVRFYGDVFGMQLLRRHRSEDHDYAQEEVMLSSAGEGQGGHILILIHYLRRPHPAAGAAWTGFVVPDMDGVLGALDGAGGRVAVAAHENPGHGVRAAILEDPDGHVIEAVQFLSPSA